MSLNHRKDDWERKGKDVFELRTFYSFESIEKWSAKEFYEVLAEQRRGDPIWLYYFAAFINEGNPNAISQAMLLKDSLGVTTMHYATQYLDSLTFSALITQCDPETINFSLEETDKNEFTPLHYAVLFQDHRGLFNLLKKATSEVISTTFFIDYFNSSLSVTDLAEKRQDKFNLIFIRLIQTYMYLVTRRKENNNEDYQIRINDWWHLLNKILKKQTDYYQVIRQHIGANSIKCSWFASTHYLELREDLLADCKDVDDAILTKTFEYYKDFLKIRITYPDAIEQEVANTLLAEQKPYSVDSRQVHLLEKFLFWKQSACTKEPLEHQTSIKLSDFTL